MSATRPTTTPALLIGPRTLRPPMLANLACTWYTCEVEKDARFATLSDRNSSAAKPAATKMPTHRSMVERFMLSIPSGEHQCREYEVERQNGERRGDHGARGGARYALGGGRRVEALEHRDPGHRHAEHHALDDAVHDVFPDVHRRLHLRPEGAGVDADQLHADDVAAVNAHRREQRGKQRHRQHAAPEA